MRFDEWAIRWNLPAQALTELASIEYDLVSEQTYQSGSEQGVQARCMLEASKRGGRLWRNNVGVLLDSRGVPVRYGLANTSKRVNENFKSADLIGIRPITIGPEWVGYTIGQFVSLECKKPNWTYTGKGRETAQMNWAQLVRGLGGHAGFVTNTDEMAWA